MLFGWRDAVGILFSNCKFYTIIQALYRCLTHDVIIASSIISLPLHNSADDSYYLILLRLLSLLDNLFAPHRSKNILSLYLTNTERSIHF